MSSFADGFRLAGASSECSLKSKARVDALFGDSRSVCSSTVGGWYAEVPTSTDSGDVSAEEQNRVNSAVQARIEAMFASVEAETPGESVAAILPVRYLGAAPVGGRVASVRGLQEPLRDLLGRLEESSPAELEVSRRGLTFRTSETSEKTSPFRRIAVWSALRLRSKRIPGGDLHHAFIPLVGDDSTNGNEDKHTHLYRTMRGLERDAKSCPPIFAVVMRRPDAARLLECHAFACQTEEVAVAAAATLYLALLADLDANRRRPRHTNGVGCVSLASATSSVWESSPPSKDNFRGGPERPTAPHPVRPPRIKKISVSSATEEDLSSSSYQKKLPKRKNKTLDVKSEDVLEGRCRRSSISPSRPPAPPMGFGEYRDCNRDNIDSRTRKGKESSVLNGIDEGNHPNKNRRNNREVDKVLEGKNGKLRSIDQESHKQNEKDSNLNAWKQNKTRSEHNYEKLSAESTVHGLNGNPQMHDTSSELITYDKNSTAFRERGISYSKTSKESFNCNQDINSVSGQGKIYSIAQSGQQYNEKMCDRKQETNFHDQKQNGKRRSQEKLYEEHFKDAYKIHNMGQEEVGLKTRKSNQNKDTLSQTKIQENVYSGQGTSRVCTMDKLPINPKCNFDDPTIPRYSQPRGRKASRAQSEPPRSRSEETPKVLHEKRIEKAQSELDLDRGDLMTRVELPRRGSFLNAGSTRRPNNFLGGTPLGFTELFDEFRNQEGLTSVDDILAAIIDPEGMSFNNLKPLYKEFLIKLAATLTRDELYQRSASIMRRRRRPQRRRSTRRSCLLGRAIRRSVCRFRGGPTEFSSVIFPSRRFNDSLGSTSSRDTRNNRNRVLISRLGSRRSSWRGVKTGVGYTTLVDSDTCRRIGRAAGANRSSSGYVSCSECSYDSESCTCVSADKCYCSLSRRGPPARPPGRAVVCSCDTDSCSESNKCYCARRPPTHHPTILEQLRQRGIVPLESTLSRAGTSERVKTSRSRSQSSRSVEFVKIQSPSTPSYSDLALDYDLFNPGKNTQRSPSNEKVLMVSARDTQGQLVYVGATERDKIPLPSDGGRSRAHHEALSMKKSAEIAAVFGRGSARTSRTTSSVSSLRSSTSLEAGLGYLP